MIYILNELKDAKMKYDLHIHSKYSYDDILEPKDTVKIEIKRA